jgi:hypothetical protein
MRMGLKMGLKMKLKRREVFGLTKGNLLHDLHNVGTQCLLGWTECHAGLDYACDQTSPSKPSLFSGISSLPDTSSRSLIYILMRWHS